MKDDPFKDLGPRPLNAYSPPDTRSALPGVTLKFSMRRRDDGTYVPACWTEEDSPEYRRQRMEEVIQKTVEKACSEYCDRWQEFLEALPRLLHKYPEFSVDENLEIYRCIFEEVVLRMES